MTIAHAIFQQGIAVDQLCDLIVSLVIGIRYHRKILYKDHTDDKGCQKNDSGKSPFQHRHAYRVPLGPCRQLKTCADAGNEHNGKHHTADGKDNHCRG